MTELLYKVDKRDRILGSVEKDEAHEKGILHRSGVVFLMRSDDKILVQWRSGKKKTFPNCYECSASFHVTFGETYKQAAERELKEEIGVTARVHYLGKFTHFDYPENGTVAVFSARSDGKITLDSNETDYIRFYSVSRIDQIARSDKAAPWFKGAWDIARDKIKR